MLSRIKTYMKKEDMSRFPYPFLSMLTRWALNKGLIDKTEYNNNRSFTKDKTLDNPLGCKYNYEFIRRLYCSLIYHELELFHFMVDASNKGIMPYLGVKFENIMCAEIRDNIKKIFIKYSIYINNEGESETFRESVAHIVNTGFTRYSEAVRIQSECYPVSLRLCGYIMRLTELLLSISYEIGIIFSTGMLLILIAKLLIHGQPVHVVPMYRILKSHIFGRLPGSNFYYKVFYDIMKWDENGLGPWFHMYYDKHGYTVHRTELPAGP